jgi:hypothetical protein
VTEIACGPVTKQVDGSLPIRIQSVQALIALVWAVPVPASGLLRVLASARGILVLPPTSPGWHELTMLAHALAGALLRTEGIALPDFTPVLGMLAVTASATPEEGTHTHTYTHMHTYTHTHTHTHTFTQTSHTHRHTHTHTHTHKGAGRMDAEQVQEAALSAERVLRQAAKGHGHAFDTFLQRLLKRSTRDLSLAPHKHMHTHTQAQARTASVAVAGSSPAAKRHRGEGSSISIG